MVGLRGSCCLTQNLWEQLEVTTSARLPGSPASRLLQVLHVAEVLGLTQFLWEQPELCDGREGDASDKDWRPTFPIDLP
jgi:hypothetical protein